MSEETEKRLKSWIKVLSKLLIAVGTVLAGMAKLIQALS